jgi:phage-related minor tail protein
VRQLAAALYEKEEASKAAKEAEEAHKRAVQEIITEAQQLIPTYDLAKQALDEWKEKTLSDLGEVTEENRRYLELLEQIYQIKLKEIYDKSLEDSRKWEDGASRALKRYADEATNAAKNAEEVFGNAARKIEDSLVEALTTGEFSMKKLGDLIMSIQQDILRAFIRQQITGPIAGALGDIVQGSGGDIFGSIFGSLFHEGGVVGAVTARRAVSARAFIGAPRLHNGLMPDEFPAILQKGETVLPKNTKMGGNTVVFNISTPNAQSFMDSRSQIMAKFAGEMQRSKMRNS